MAMLWMDGFDKYGTDADLAGRGYTAVTASTHFLSTGGRGGAGGVQCAGGDSDFIVPLAIASGTRFHTAAWYYFSGGAPVGDFTSWWDASNAGSGLLGNASADGTLTGRQWGAAGGYDSAPGVLLGATWQHIETDIIFDDTAGIFKVWVDEVLVIDIAGDTISGSGPINTITQMIIEKAQTSGSTDTIVDDLVIWDESGTVWASSQLKKHKIETLTPNGAGAHSDFTPSAGSNYENIDDAGVNDGNTTYNQTALTNVKDAYALSDLSSVPDKIFGAQTVAIARYTDNPCDVKNLLRSSVGDEVQGDAHTIGVGFAPYVDFFSKDPTTNLPFTAPNVNGMQSGITKIT